uniref:Cry45Aa-like protein 1 n=1 Tax=Bacillus thuringiensis TaxID=1428 RepID=A0A1Q1NKM9_BACTU|nr:Cry45Aa-like protein 1 [Bacillus thuringiensis]
MAILDLKKLTEDYWRDFCIKNKYEFVNAEMSWLNGQYPVRLYNLNVQVPDPIVTDNPTNSAVARGVTPNPTSQPIVRTVGYTETLTDSQSTTTEHGVTAGASVTVKSEAGFLFAKVGVEATVSFEYNYTTSKTYTTEISRSWTDSVTITVPPGYQTTHTFIVQTGPFDKNVVLECDIDGYTMCYYRENGITKYVNHSMARILHEMGYTDSTHIYVAHFIGSGKLEGKMGLQSYVNVVETPLPGRAGQTREYQIPVTRRSGLDIPIFDPIVSRQ